MPIECIDSFDLYNGAASDIGVASTWTLTGNAAVSLVTGRFGGQAMRHTPGSVTSAATIGLTATAGKAVSFAVRIPTLGSMVASEAVFVLSSAAFAQLYLSFSPTGEVNVWRSTNTTLVTNSGTGNIASAGVLLGSSPPGRIVANTWHFIEFIATSSATLGVIEVWVDGVRVINLINQNTRNQSQTTFNGFSLYRTWNGNNPLIDIDDFFVNDTNVRIGEGRVEVLRPSGDVTVALVPDTGTVNFSRVNETLINGDLSYVSGSAVGDVDRYSFDNLSTSPASIYAVQMVGVARKTDAATRSFNLRVVSGATTSDGPDLPLAAGYTWQRRILLTDPNTGAAWLPAAVNAMEGGPRVSV